MIEKLVKPLSYLKIKHREKRWFDLFIPLILSLCITLILILLPRPITYVGERGLISLVNGMLQILSGFYIASLAAIATFQREGMDDKPANGSLGILNGCKLSRRQFLTYLFGYLAFMSIVMYFVGGFVLLISNSISSITSGSNYLFIKQFLVFIYLIPIANIMTTTALGMHFLIDRMHRNETKLIDKSPKDD